MLRILAITVLGLALPWTPLSAAAATPGNAEAPPAPAVAFRAMGNEPSWRLDIGPAEMVLLTDFGQARLVAPTPTAQVAGATTIYVASTERGQLTATIVERLCIDSMSGMPHPQTVTVVVAGQTLSGCGGQPASLLQGAEWAVEKIDGARLVPGSQVTLSFAADGRLSGRSSCNRYTSEYALSGEGLSISKIAGTKMLCESPLMEQERVFLELLGGTRSFSIAADDALLLLTSDGRTLQARR